MIELRWYIGKNQFRPSAGFIISYTIKIAKKNGQPWEIYLGKHINKEMDIISIPLGLCAPDELRVKRKVSKLQVLCKFV